MDEILILDQISGETLIRSASLQPIHSPSILNSISSTSSQSLLHLKPSSNQLHPSAFNLQSSSSTSSHRQHLPLHLHSTSLNPVGTILCHLSRHQLRFVALTTGDVEPAHVFTFINQFIRLLQLYLPSLSPSSIQAHFALVLQLIDLVCPSPGAPLSLSPASQPDLLLATLPRPTPVLANFLAQAADSLKRTTSSIASRPSTLTSPTPRVAPSLFTSPLPWRPINLSYPNEEVYLDICESLSVTTNNKGVVITSSLGGRIDVQSKLSGMPELSLSFTDPARVLHTLGFHSCVRHGRWLRDRTVCFVPPDRGFALMSFRSRSIPTSLPLTTRAAVTLGRAGGSFAIQLTAHVHLTQICLRWHLGPNATGLLSDRLLARLHNTSNRGPPLSERWEWEVGTSSLIWHLDALEPGQSVILNGIWTHSTPNARPAPSMLIEFESPPLQAGPSTSGLQVDKLTILDSAGLGHHAHVQKGVRTRLENGRVELRWC